MSRRRSDPRSLGSVVGALRREATPRTPLAAAQAVWVGAVGDAVARQAQPVAERDGVLTVACRSASWAQELDLLQSELLERVVRALQRAGAGAGRDAGKAPIRALRFTADLARHDT